uniref:non-specific serine/threonine protein kinase n=1 Tax=Timema douglasi TaxID=61478 RepID=A0A7R8VDV9_TIMDO|nr:unnamed protein product [Timema douglasi]
MTGHLKVSQIDEAVKFRNQKDNLKQVEAQEEQRLIRDQKDYLELEIRKFRRKKLLVFHNLEQELLRENPPDLSLSSPHTPSAPLIPQSSEKVAAHPPDKEGDRENKERRYKGQQLEHAGPTARL